MTDALKLAHALARQLDTFTRYKGAVAPGLVLDPFGGAGTVGVVAEREGRHAILIELNADYVAIAESRLAHAREPHGQTALFAGGAS